MVKRAKSAVRSSNSRRYATSLAFGLALIAAAVAFRAWDPAALQLLRLKTFDLYQLAKPRESAERPVVIIDIDEKSLRRLGQWPWPRTVLADLVRKLDDYGVRATAFDVLFAEADEKSLGEVLKYLPSVDPALEAAARVLPTNDEVFAGAVQSSTIVLAQSGVRGDAVVAEHGPRPSISIMGEDPQPFLVQFPTLLRNLPILEAGAAGFGLISLPEEIDNVVRRVPAIATVEGEYAPTLALELLRVAQADDATAVVRTTSAGVDGVILGDLFVPTAADGQLWVHFGKSDRDRYVSVVDVLDGVVDRSALEGKLALVGTSAIGLFDIRSTPLESAVPGVEVHAQLLETMLTGEQLVRPEIANGIEVAMAMAVGLFIVFTVPRLGAVSVLLLGMGAAAGLFATSWYLFAEHRVLIDVVYPLITSLGVWGVLTFYNYSREEQERSFVRNAFGRYLAPDVVERLADDPSGLSLGGEMRTLTILFMDVRGFTAISEGYKDDPQGLTQLLNSFLTPLSNAIVERDGTIDKYMGDAIMAFWNAPLDVEDHAAKACEAALDMRRRLDALNQERAESAARTGRPAPPIDIGVGLNSGDCVVGNMGSELRFDYSVLGDAVNVASRVEGLTKQYGVEVLVGSSTAELAGEACATIAIDRIRVKGKLEPETVYVLLGMAETAADPGFRTLKEHVGALRDRYLAQDWDGAAAASRAARQADRDGALGAYLTLMDARVAGFRNAPPSANWDGVWVATSK